MKLLNIFSQNKIKFTQSAHFFVASLRDSLIIPISMSRSLLARALKCIRLRKFYRKRASGITLIEIILVIAIMSATLSLGLFVNMDSHRGDTFRSSRDLLVATLEHARAQAVNNICLGTGCVNGKTHGVHIATDSNNFVTSYILFQGEPYNSADPLNTTMNVSGNTSRNISLSLGSDINIYFEQLSGDSNLASITLTNDVETSIITINSEGRITWTN